MLMIRLRRQGARNAPFYRVVVSDSRRTPKASPVEMIGYYNPRRKPAEVVIDRERIDYWVSHGAQLSPTVKRLLGGPPPVKEKPAKPAPKPAAPPAEEVAPAAEAEAAPAEEAAAEEAPAAEAEAAPAEEAAAEEAPAAEASTAEEAPAAEAEAAPAEEAAAEEAPAAEASEADAEAEEKA